MASKLNELMAKLNKTEGYTALSDAEIARQANQRYQSLYDQKRLGAKQTYEVSDAALGRQLESLQASYDQQRAQSRAENRRTYSQADQQALSRGMQRSSYNNATLANITLAGDAAQRQIDQAQAAQENDITQQRSLLSRQYAQQLEQYDADQRSDALSYADELAAREYDRTAASQKTQNDLAMKIYEYQHQLEQEAAEAARWERLFQAKYGG